MVSPMAAIFVAVGVAVLVGIAEWLHARRRRRIGHLAFGSARAGRPRVWVGASGWLRAAAAGATAWGLLTLLGLDGTPAEPDPLARTDRRLLVCLDVSPSMKLKDAGPDGAQARSTRARQVVRSMLQRADLSGARVSVVAFYNGARPVVVDTWDLNIIWNIFDDLPLEYAFDDGPTKMYAGVREAAVQAERWPPRSTTLLVVSDGDTLPGTEAPRLPPSIGSTLVLGVGSPHRGQQIAGRSSRQDTASLRQLAARLGGRYLDVNSQHVPTSVASAMWPGGEGGKTDSGLLVMALAAVGAGAGVLALLDPLLMAFGTPRRRTRATKRQGAAHGRLGDRGAGRTQRKSEVERRDRAGALQGAHA